MNKKIKHLTFSEFYDWDFRDVTTLRLHFNDGTYLEITKSEIEQSELFVMYKNEYMIFFNGCKSELLQGFEQDININDATEFWLTTTELNTICSWLQTGINSMQETYKTEIDGPDGKGWIEHETEELKNIITKLLPDFKI